jgi:hypothetical protein
VRRGGFLQSLCGRPPPYGGGPVTILAGVHLGCTEVVAKEDIRTFADLKGKIVGYAVADKTLLSTLWHA